MDYPVIFEGRAVGNCTITEQGLYWSIDCSCQVLSDRIERLYCGQTRLGVLEREGNRLTCHRRLSKASVPDLPPQSGVLTLAPTSFYTPWQGKLLDYELSCFREGDTLLFPYDPLEPCPCEPLICFFEIRDGFWRLKLQPEWEVSSQ